MSDEARRAVLEELMGIYRERGDTRFVTPDATLRQLNFRSIDFAELALRLEARAGRELDLAAGDLNRLDRVADLQAFFAAAWA